LKNPITSSGIETATFRQKGWEINKGERREGGENNKRDKGMEKRK
jgi:hypothetical protein